MCDERDPDEMAAEEAERLRAELASRPSLTIKPGQAYVNAACRAGLEDEYSERMKAKYGGEW
jgi:hypothetical protein